jgi:uncharacterized protein
MCELREVIVGYGHRNIRASHRTTLEFTKDSYLSNKGDCIVAIGTDKAVADLRIEFKEKMRKPNVELIVKIEADGISEQLTAYGSQELTLTHPRDIVIRKSYYVSDRTLAVQADKAARDLPRKLVEKLQNPQQKVEITLVVRG